MQTGCIKLTGIPVSSGITMGPAFVFTPAGITIPIYKLKTKSEVENEIKRFIDAVTASIEQIQSLTERVEKEIDAVHSNIFKTHLMILKDPLLIDETIAEIKNEKMNAEFIFNKNVEKIGSLFSKIKDEYIFERAGDINDVAKRVLKNLTNVEPLKLSQIKDRSIIIAHDLCPSDTVHLTSDKVMGFATEVGGPTSHTVILAKALELPAVVGVRGLLKNISTGDTLILDATQGTVIISPAKDDIRRYNQIREKTLKSVSFLSKIKDLPAETLDGHRIELSANVELKEEIPHALEYGADGIGLFRTEFLYIDRTNLPSEEEQFDVYKEVIESLNGKSVIFRTLDIGGDKFISSIPIAKELNPYMGLRAIRLCLIYPDMFREQLRAILRASSFGKAKIMFPMISGVEEVFLAKQHLEEVKEELRKEDVPFDPEIEVGIMIEIPSSAIASDILAKEVDFFSIGTNDLIQYTLAVDRGNESVAYLYEPFHPSVLRLIKMIVNNAHRENIWVGICGEMAGDPLTAVILLGLGLDELSMGSIAIPQVKKTIRSIRLSEAHKIADEILQKNSVNEIKNIITTWMNQWVRI